MDNSVMAVGQGSSILKHNSTYSIDVTLQIANTKKKSELQRLRRALVESDTLQRSQEIKNSVLEEQIEENKQEMARVKSDIAVLHEYEKSSMLALDGSFDLKSREFGVEFDEQLSQIKQRLAGEIEASALELKQKEEEEKKALQEQVTELRTIALSRSSAISGKIEGLLQVDDKEIANIRTEGHAKMALFGERAHAIEDRIADSLLRQNALSNALKRSQMVTVTHVDRTIEALRRKSQKKSEDNEALQALIKETASNATASCNSYASSLQNATNLQQSTKVMWSDFNRLESERRVLHNKLQELKGNIRVFCRVKPCANAMAESTDISISRELNEMGKQVLTLEKPSSISDYGELTRYGGRGSNYRFELDNIFPHNATNHEIFLEISQLVQSSLDGFNVCVFAYGQTGSGKTFTMSHPNDGMIPLSVSKIFADIQDLKTKSWEYTVRGHFVEIYNEQIVDLLATGKSELKHEIKHDDASRKTTVTNCTSVVLQSKAHAIEVLERASRKRSTASTLMNARSSRSHYAFILDIEGYNVENETRCNGTLNLIDLAGSERLNSSQARGDRLKETQAINKSLSCLGDVIHSLGLKQTASKDGIAPHVPYRNSKLTYLLKHSLGGDSKTLMFVNVSPEVQDANETINSLRFATKVNGTQLR